MKLRMINESLAAPIAEEDINIVLRTVDDLYYKTVNYSDKWWENKSVCSIAYRDSNDDMQNCEVTVVCKLISQEEYAANADEMQPVDQILVNAMASNNKMWMTIGKTESAPPTPPPELHENIVGTLYHEITHLQRPHKGNHRLRNRKTAKNPISNSSYPFELPDEMDANVHALAHAYKRLLAAGKRPSLNELIATYVPHMSPKFKSSVKWRNRLLSRLARVGVVIK